MSEQARTTPDVRCGEPIRYGSFALDGWAGVTRQRIGIIGETPTKYRVVALTDTRLAGRTRVLRRGAHALLPKTVVTLEQ